MPRALVMTERNVNASERTSYVLSINSVRQRAADAGANFWVFEKDNQPHSFLEFVEAGSAETLSAAISAISSTPLQPQAVAQVWREVTGV